MGRSERIGAIPTRNKDNIIYAEGMTKPEWSTPIGVGETIPIVNLKTRVRNDDGSFGWKDVTTEELFSSRRVVVFGVPGALGPMCNDTHLPGYLTAYDEIRTLGVDDVYCVSVDDAPDTKPIAGKDVLPEEENMGDTLGFKTVKPLQDGTATFTRGMGMSYMWNSNRGLEERSWRYSAVITDMRVEKLFMEGGRIPKNASEDRHLTSKSTVVVQYLKSCEECSSGSPGAKGYMKRSLSSITLSERSSERPLKSPVVNPRAEVENLAKEIKGRKTRISLLPSKSGWVGAQLVPKIISGRFIVKKNMSNGTQDHGSVISTSETQTNTTASSTTVPKSQSWDPRGSVNEASKRNLSRTTLSESTCKVLERVTTTFNRNYTYTMEESDRFDFVTADGEFEKIVATEYPEYSLPNARSLVKTCTHRLTARTEGARFSTGDWVEIRGPDMKWRLEMVTRVVKEAPDDWDWHDLSNEGKTPQWIFKYHAGCEKMLDGDEIRSPEEGLRRIFGARPWVFQQWAFLKVENDLRFQEGHTQDYFSTDTVKLASALWERWLNSPSNADFKRHFDDDRIGDIGRRELIDHIMVPFKLLNELKRDGSDWDFKGDPSISIFTYLSILGSGFVVPLVVCFIQVAIPFLLYVAVAGQASTKDDVKTTNAGRAFDSQVTKCMVFVVMLLYLFKVVPDTCTSFYNTLGHSESVYSRLMSLRTQLWCHGDDSIRQKAGYKIEVYMNTAYVCVLYMLNMFILFKTDQAFEVLLNALAVEFVIRLDEEIASASWWDPDKRWIIAGAAELVIKRTLRLEWLESPKLFALHFGIPEQDLLDACDGDMLLFKNEKVASVDSNRTEFMTKEEACLCHCIAVAKNMNHVAALQDMQKPCVHFGLIDHVRYKVFGRRGGGMFDKHGPFRTWSRWERVLYMSPPPDLDEVFLVDRKGNARVARPLANIFPTHDAPFANFDPEEFSTSALKIFIRQFVNVLSFRNLVQGLMLAWKKHEYSSILFRLFDGFLEWSSYMIQVMFPLVATIAPFSVLYSMFGWESTYIPEDPFVFLEL